DGILHHFIAALATCDVTATRREERLWDFYAFHEDGVLQGEQSDIRAYLVPPQPGARRLAENLAAQGIEVQVSRGPSSAGQARDALTGAPSAAVLPAGTFVYPLDQPFSRYLRAVMEPSTALPEEFVAEELRHHGARLPDRFYDITAWARPLALGLRWFEAPAAIDVRTDPLGPMEPASALAPEPCAVYVIPDT